MSRNETSQASVKRAGPGPDVIVFGQIARDLVLVVDAVPPASRRHRRPRRRPAGPDAEGRAGSADYAGREHPPV